MQKVYEVLPKNKNCFATRWQANDLVEATGPVREKEIMAPEGSDRSVAVDEALGYVIYT